MSETSALKWWQRGIIYQIYPRSFQDSDGDGVGDLRGVIQRLDYLAELGVDAVWLSPFFKSPMADFGYDVSDYCDVDPLFGDLDTFDELLHAAHARGIKVIIDYVPNHSSDEHAWFIESRANRDNPKADWYYWRDPKPDGSLPNNWGSVFGGPAWTWDETRQQYYFHQFDPKQPDLNWRNPDVKAAMLDVLRFWLDRGVDGFRMDVVYMIWKHPDLPDQPTGSQDDQRGEADQFANQQQVYAFNYAGIHAVMQDIRAVVDEGGDTVAVGEIWLPLPELMKYYGENLDEFHLPFNFMLIGGFDWTKTTPLHAAALRALVDEYDGAIPPGGWPNYVLGSHDAPRMASRLGSEARARVGAMLLLTLRGTPTLYMGDEIGMVNGDIPLERIQDPQGIRIGAAQSRDQCRTPVQWDDSPYAGFSTAAPWLPVNADYKTCNIAAQQRDPRSMLSLYKRLIALRQDTPALFGGDYQALDSAPDECFVYLRTADDQRVLVALNFSDAERLVNLPTAGRLLVSTSMDVEAETAISGALTLRANEGVVLLLDA